MNYINNSYKKPKKRNSFMYIIGIVICIAISLYLLTKINIPGISNFAGSFVNTLENVFSSIGGFFTQGTSYFGNTKKLNNEVENLEATVKELEYVELENEKLKQEIEDLNELLNISKTYSHFELKYGNVIYRNYDEWNQTFIIDVGIEDGIKEGQTVVTSKGLVGYISTVSKNNSIVTTIMDPSTSVSVEISSINQLALLKGDFSLKDSEKVKLTYIPIDVEVSVNESIYTSGIGENYPKGIPIGNIESVSSKKNDMNRYAVVTPYVDFNALDMVGIILD